ncbi:hypothetical protein GCM10018980_48910 [Streptomyces capoamus]|uniref:Uncharacterized protein n=1 Tax=Streptomyces capoamus TaxID=68183 RepID=A0A919KDR1_9ACTN|nr:hypothetical protein GCM10010501_07760 [Streptomyces libani subsp. rufus]GHG60454.1 hypothetical protein GCM10018980_48910 [Streptomyces capoamus]
MDRGGAPGVSPPQPPRRPGASVVRIIGPDQGQSGQLAEGAYGGPAPGGRAADGGIRPGPVAGLFSSARFADESPGHTRGRRSGRGPVRARDRAKWLDSDAKAPAQYAPFNFWGLLERDSP